MRTCSSTIVSNCISNDVKSTMTGDVLANACTAEAPAYHTPEANKLKIEKLKADIDHDAAATLPGTIFSEEMFALSGAIR